MCNFLSFITTKDGRRLYAPERRVNGEDYDSHSYIAKRFGVLDLDQPNFYEYAPIGDNLVLDAGQRKEDINDLREWAKMLPYAEIVPELIIKPIIKPFNIARGPVTDADIALLKRWDSVRDSVGASVRASVRDSVGASVWASVRDSVGDSVWDSVRDSVWDSVRDSVGASVWDSVWASVGAYISSFFNLPQWKYTTHEPNTNPFQCCIDLWEVGLVPSFDGKTWRLHAGEKAEIVWEGIL